METPDLFPSIGFGIAPGKRAFIPKPTPANHRRLIARCTKKGCKFCKAVDVPTVEKETFQSYLTSKGWERHKTGTIRVLEPSARAAAHSALVCPAHGVSFLTTEEVQGRLSEGHKCDPRCTGARGHNCECACAGANHGADYL